MQLITKSRLFLAIKHNMVILFVLQSSTYNMASWDSSLLHSMSDEDTKVCIDHDYARVNFTNITY